MRKIFVLLFAQLIFAAALSLSSCSKIIEDPANNNRSDKDLHPAFSTQTVQSETFTVNGVSFNMMFVHAGSFQMGAGLVYSSCFSPRERPCHDVTLTRNYYLGETEVTQGLWQAVMGYNPSECQGDSLLPVENVTWYDCQEFIRRLNELTGRSFRLPTEAEWEFAARGGNNNTYPYRFPGNPSIGYVCWYNINTDGCERPVKLKLPNELGLYDMSGNVQEWCQDRYGAYTSDPQIDPTGYGDDTNRVLRGGSWISAEFYCRIPYRSDGDPDLPCPENGFRLALSE